MTEAVPLGELLHQDALFGLTGVRKVGVPRGRLFPSGLCLSARFGGRVCQMNSVDLL